MIREDRELLAELARINREMAALAMRIMDGSATPTEQHSYAQRLITAGERLGRRAEGTAVTVIDGEIVTSGGPALPATASLLDTDISAD